jgi:DNA polymerase-3 subunit epsilon
VRDKLHSYLIERADGAGSEELLSQIFSDKGDDEHFGREFLKGLLAGDPRFTSESDGGHWSLSDDNSLDLPLEQARFVVVDLETTGQSPDTTGITEIGAVRIENGKEVGRFDTLVNPGRPIPPYVAKLTGITDDMVADAPPIEELIQGFVDFSADAILVAHNAAFDAALLDQMTRRILGRPLGLPSLCTLKLTRVLMPELTKASLDALSEHFELTSEARHRAMADAELTTSVLERLIVIDGGRCKTVGELLTAQEEAEGEARVRLQLSRRELESLPAAPGVYWLIAEDGSTLYVGSAANLHDEVLEGYLTPTHRSGRQRAMLSAAAELGFHATACPLEKSLVESREMRRRNPEFNRGDRHLPRGFYVKVSHRGPFPRVHVSARIARDGGTYVGPIKGKNFAEDAAALLARLYGLRTCPGPITPDPEFEACELAPAGACTSPCDGSVTGDAYTEQLESLEAALRGDGAALHARIDTRATEQGTERSRDAAILSRLLKLNRRRPWVVNAHNYLVAVPGCQDGLLLAAVLGGFCRTTRYVRTEAELAEYLGSIGPDMLKPRRKMGAFEADASTIMSHWIRRSRSEQDDAGSLLVELDPADLVTSVRDAAVDLAPLLEGPAI